MSPIDLSSIEAILFDIDGTLVDSDHLHYEAYNEIMIQYGEKAVTEAYFYANISGTHYAYIHAKMFPNWSKEKIDQFGIDKEARFRELAGNKLQATKGLNEICNWIDRKRVKKAAVTNSPRINAEMMLKGIGRKEYFQTLIIGEECPRAKPYPDPYIIAIHQPGVGCGATVVGITSGRSAEELLKLWSPLFFPRFYRWSFGPCCGL
eukprot:TRINITY_DN2312_c1_g6_i3.p1 TRINITY_DN2312_c1_g6~~TRINITY_DN2312_c1_g6_i3.p1  ORF type:complete len:216 (-),score=24.07 TRINITY_DN2312_c1_g6_i3:30-647(-)